MNDAHNIDRFGSDPVIDDILADRYAASGCISKRGEPLAGKSARRAVESAIRSTMRCAAAMFSWAV
jgi:hypothetical protein